MWVYFVMQHFGMSCVTLLVICMWWWWWWWCRKHIRRRFVKFCQLRFICSSVWRAWTAQTEAEWTCLDERTQGDTLTVMFLHLLQVDKLQEAENKRASEDESPESSSIVYGTFIIKSVMWFLQHCWSVCTCVRWFLK